ncbi:MAG: hypothetical protein ACPL1G_02695 [Thermodesulfovibrionales bacterium]
MNKFNEILEASPIPLWQDIVFSLILVPHHDMVRDSEAFASLYYKYIFIGLSAKETAQILYYILPFIAVHRFMFNLITENVMLTEIFNLETKKS